MAIGTLDPVRATRLGSRAGDLVPRVARQGKHVARACGVSPQAVSQWKQGATYGPLYDALVAADRLGAALSTERTDPYPAIVEMEVVVMEANLRHRSTEDLVREWRHLYRAESEAESRENMASSDYLFRRDLRTLAEAHKAEAAHQIRFAAICEVLAERGVDPLAPEWDWMDR